MVSKIYLLLQLKVKTLPDILFCQEYSMQFYLSTVQQGNNMFGSICPSICLLSHGYLRPQWSILGLGLQSAPKYHYTWNQGMPPVSLAQHLILQIILSTSRVIWKDVILDQSHVQIAVGQNLRSALKKSISVTTVLEEHQFVNSAVLRYTRFILHFTQ